MLKALTLTFQEHGPDFPRLRVDREARLVLRAYRQAHPDQPEAGGLLLGARDSEVFPTAPHAGTVEQVTVPAPGDRATRTGFDRLALLHVQLMESKRRSTGGRVDLMGEWHTHPEPDPVPSREDLASWASTVQRNWDVNWFVFLIQGTGDAVGAWLLRQRDARYYPGTWEPL